MAATASRTRRPARSLDASSLEDQQRAGQAGDAAEATEVVEFSFVSESDTLVFAGDTWALPMQIRRRKTAERASAPDEEDSSRPSV